jgi:hypothetical protein
MVFMDQPRFVGPQAYSDAIERMCRRFAKVPGLVSIFQIGHVSTPGISDIDLLFVFEDDTSFRENPLTGLSRLDRYLFVHSPFAVGMANYEEAMRFTFFHNYRLLHGRAPIAKVTPLSAEQEECLKRQIALEYLVRIFVSLSVEIKYGVLKLRNFFLHAKALLYDCEFLKSENGLFPSALRRIVGIRNQWFDNPKRLLLDVHSFHQEFLRFLSAQLEMHEFYLPAREHYRLAGHLRLTPATRLCIRHHGTVLPPAFVGLGRRCFNLQHRFNRFEFGLPFRTTGCPPILEQVFKSRDEIETAGRMRFPHFLSLASNLASQGASIQSQAHRSQPQIEVACPTT